MTKQILGEPIKRREDPEMLRGAAKFTADINLPGMLHMAILHSSHAHALIKGIDVSAAAQLPGVVRIFTAADLAGKMMPLPCIWKPGGVESFFPPHPYGLPGAQNALATDRVRYVGEQVAVVVAETRRQAYDALAAIKVDYEPLPVVVTAEEALKEGAPQLHETVPNNLNTHISYGDKAAADQAVEDAEVVIRHTFRIPRLIHNTIEPRASVGQYEAATGEYTLWTNTQIPHGNRFLISQLVLGIPFNKLRVIAPYIGGGYGSRGYLYPDAPLVLVLSKELGRPIKWVDTRAGLARSTVHAREMTQYVTLAGSRDGTITALACTSYVNTGAYPPTNGPSTASLLTGRSITGPYTIAHPFYEVYSVFANTVPLAAARGAGRMEAVYLVERMVDLFAREIGLDPAEVRRKNLVRPEQFPYDNGLGWTYDTGNYEVALDRALAAIGYDQLPQRKAEAQKRGKRLGVGISSYSVVAGVGPSPRMGSEGLIGSTWGSALVRVEPTGEVSVSVGSQPHGQGQVTTFSQIVAQELGIDIEQVQVLHSDSHGMPYAQGSYGSRTFSVEGATVYKAVQHIKEKACKVGAHLLKVAEEAVIYADGGVRLRDAPDQVVPLRGIAEALWYAWNLPPGVEPGLETITFFDPAEFNFPFGSHIALVEIDEQTGQVELVRYVTVDDVGNVGNPMIVDGQMIGSITFGLGLALQEEGVFDKDGQLLTDGFDDYAIPRASQLPNFELDRTVTPTPTNPLGAKGAGDVGAPAAAPAVVNAICDALADTGVRDLDMPVTPEKIWQALQVSQLAEAVGE